MQKFESVGLGTVNESLLNWLPYLGGKIICGFPASFFF